MWLACGRLATIANNNTDNIVITAFLNLTSVSIYGAYSYLTEAVLKIIFESLYKDLKEILALLTASIKTAKINIQHEEK